MRSRILLLLLVACNGNDDSDAPKDEDTDVQDPGCATVPVCDGDPWCHFKSTVDGLNVQCFQDSDNGDEWILRVEATGIPDHAYGDPRGEVWDQQWSFDIPLEPSTPAKNDQVPCPEPSDQGARLFGPKGIAINGVSLYYPLSIEYVDPIAPPAGYAPESLDYCDAHGAAGAYHYHVNPPCLFGVYQDGQSVTGVLNVGPDYSSMESSFERGEWPKPSGIIAFSLEGHPVYGPYADEAGSAHTGLDACNGKVDESGQYAYYVTNSFPYMLGCAAGGKAITDTYHEDWSCTANPPPGAPTEAN